MADTPRADAMREKGGGEEERERVNLIGHIRAQRERKRETGREEGGERQPDRSYQGTEREKGRDGEGGRGREATW